MKSEKGYRSVVKWLLLLSAVVLVSCSQTKFVPQGEYLLNKVELEPDNTEIDKEEAKTFVRQKENHKILGFAKFYLLLYNLSSKKKSEGWLKKIGEAPQIYDEELADRSVRQLKQYMENKGFYQAQVNKEVVLNERKQKADLTFTIKGGKRYSIHEVRYHFSQPELKEIFMSDSLNRRFRPGKPFDIYDLETQQEEIVKLYRNKGYFYFSKNLVRFVADTTQYKHQVILDLHVGDVRGSKIDSAKVLRPFYLNRLNYSVIPGSASVDDFESGGVSFSDTLAWGKSRLFLPEQYRYPPGLFQRSTLINSGDLYKISEVENTFNTFNRLGQFRYVDIQFEETYPDQDSNLIDCNVRLVPMSKQSLSFDVDGTNSSGDFGVAGNIYYQHRNIFNGAEALQVKLTGALERTSYTSDDESEYYNTRELGAEAKLSIPKLLGPGKFIRSFRRNLPKTVINFGYNYQSRPEYTRTISNVKLGYDWKTSQLYSHSWNFLDLNLVHLFEFDEAFVDSIEDLYIKSSFIDHFIFSTNYTLTYNNQGKNLKDSYTYVKFNVESSGNTLWLLSKLTGQEKHTDSSSDSLVYYQFLGTQYSQYLKGDIEIRRGIRLDEYNRLVGRFFFGIGVPYGNSQTLPYEKQYFAGGANGIRAWQARSLGPGTYSASDDSYPTQLSDIKIEGNIEYRYKLIGKMEGALFVDAGNIWAINSYDTRDGAQFKFSKFYRQIAVGTGTGFRFDLNYFILRFDVGLKLCDPSADSGERWIIGNRSFTSDDLNFTFAIGYPF